MQTRSIWLSKLVLSIMAGEKYGSCDFYWLRSSYNSGNLGAWKLQKRNPSRSGDQSSNKV